MQINLSDIFVEIENFIFQLLFFLVLFPKTVIQSVIRPKWIHGYVTEELKKAQNEQFKEYMNPLYFFILSYFISSLIAGVILTKIEPGASSLLSAQTLALSAIPYLFLPIPFALGLLFINRKPINEVEYKRAYYIQLIIMAIGFMLFLVICLFALPLLTNQNGSLLTSAFYTLITLGGFVVATLWFLAAQTITFYNEILQAQTAVEKKSKLMLKAFLATIACSMADAILMANFGFIGDLIEATKALVTP
ncbi:MAG: hypothetical protein IT310_02365 [Anaerolineales bacterium]|nr:hypothetical protein [Anaerolineales bacterium]